MIRESGEHLKIDLGKPKGFMTERGHAAQWEQFDAQTAKRIRHRGQQIIDTYFPGGRPVEG